jgi:hypothetical protein
MPHKPNRYIPKRPTCFKVPWCLYTVGHGLTPRSRPHQSPCPESERPTTALGSCSLAAQIAITRIAVSRALASHNQRAIHTTTASLSRLRQIQSRLSKPLPSSRSLRGVAHYTESRP